MLNDLTGNGQYPLIGGGIPMFQIRRRPVNLDVPFGTPNEMLAPFIELKRRPSVTLR